MAAAAALKPLLPAPTIKAASLGIIKQDGNRESL
jgi:hypothetical protein